MSRVIQQALAWTSAYKQKVDKWRNPAYTPYYPLHIKEKYDGGWYYRTLVRIERDGKWYRVLVVESFDPPDTTQLKESAIKAGVGQWESEVIQRLHHNAHFVRYLYRITGTMEDLEDNQIPEADRLRQYFPHLSK